jgi:hypothetical protein
MVIMTSTSRHRGFSDRIGNLAMDRLARVKDKQFLVELLLEIERRVDVNAIQIDGVHLWPIIRLNLGRKFKEADPLTDAGLGQQAEEAHNSAPAQIKDGFPRSVAERRYLRQSRRAQFVRSPEAARKYLDDQWDRLRRIGTVDFVILSTGHKYHQVINGQRYAPILDPVLEDLNKRGRALMVAFEPLAFACVNEPVKVDIEPHMILTSAQTPSNTPSIMKQLAAVNDVVRAIAPEFVVSPQQIIKHFDRTRKRLPFFHKLLETLQPRALFMSNFTSWLPAIWAARRLGIPTVDIQHGGQHSAHHRTTHYGHVPRNGYHYLPDYFWVWGELNRRYIDKWLPGGAVRHIPIVGGHRNVAKWYRDRDEGRLAHVDQDFLQRFSGQNGLILVTLCYAVDRVLPEVIVDAVQASPDLTWLIRLHPNHRNKETRDQMVAFLNDRGCGNFYVDEPTEVQLYTVLSICHHHVTPFSTSGREATAFAVPTTICDSIGAQIFKEDIDAGLFYYEDNYDSLVQRIRSGLQAEDGSPSHRQQSIEVSDTAVDALLERVLSANNQPRSALHRAMTDFG